MFGPLLEVAMSKKCTPLWRGAHFEVKMLKAPGVRTTCGGSDVVSRGRRKTWEPPDEARRLLQDLGESPAMWLNLTVADAVAILKILRDHSEWPQVKRTEDELLRREYLKRFDECFHFQSDWIHTEMRQRQAARADAAQRQAGRADASQMPHVPACQRWQRPRVCLF